MAGQVRTAFFCVLASIVFLASLYHNLFKDQISYVPQQLLQSPAPLLHITAAPSIPLNYAIHDPITLHKAPPFSSLLPSISTFSILLPDWEVLVVVSSPLQPHITFSDSDSQNLICLFNGLHKSPAIPARTLPFPNRMTFKCALPPGARRRLPFLQPLLTNDSPVENRNSPMPELIRWNFLVYESLHTEHDVVVFAKGLNNRQGLNRPPSDFRCVFGDDTINAVRTEVTHSFQEVFRCKRPESTALSLPRGEDEPEEEEHRIKISLEIAGENRVLPSVAYYTPSPKVVPEEEKSLLCACTMVYNVAKFLKEWVMYHSKIGVERFFLYDNDSDDDLQSVVDELVRNGYDVTTLFWMWPKTQEAGFSHCAMYAKSSCSWMMYIDVDEFVYSPKWLMLDSSSPQPQNNTLLKSLIPHSSSSFSTSLRKSMVGQLMISCYEFGPSNQKTHPATGVTQGYNCRRRMENRHKSIVRLDAIEGSLLNVVHHFNLKKGFRNKKVRMEDAAVNHYKFQAWTEFKAKFKRRVSAYVVDWTQTVNPASKDRTPGLGFEAVEPKGWNQKFCEVYDDRLQELTKRWFSVADDSSSSSSSSSSSYQMVWQS